MTTAIIAAITSLLISLLSLIQSLRNQRMQRQQFEKGQNRELTKQLYELRIENYPKAFDISDKLILRKGGSLEREDLKEVCHQLWEWKKGVVSLIISKKSLNAFYDLTESLSKNPVNVDKYSKVQIDNIWNAKMEFRSQLRKDVGFLYIEE